VGKLRLACLWGIAGLGVGFEWLGHNGGIGLAAADLAVGLAFLACGVLVGHRQRRERVALLLLATGFAWFLGTLAGSDVGVVSTVGSAMLYAHRGPFVQLVLAYPTGRLRSRLDGVVVCAAYVDGLVVALAQDDAATIALVTAVVAAGALGLRGGPVELRRARALATAAFALVGAPLVWISVGGLAQARPLSDTTLLLAYEVALLASVIGLTVWLLLGERFDSGVVADFVVELGMSRRSGAVRDALARALGDPTLEIGYPVAGSYVDEAGEPMTLPSSGDERTATSIECDGEPVAVLVHDAALASDLALTGAVAAAARLTASNVRLQAELRVQVRELAASRRRIVEAGDVQRSRLERRLDQAAELHLAKMRVALARAMQAAPPEVADALATVGRELDQVVIEIRELARGIHPHTLHESGLAAALSELATAAPLRVSVAAPSERFTPAVETAAYFVCAEALANVAKYAQAEAATIGVRRENGRLVVRVFDEGVGGADATRGSGLRGMGDRVEALGGRLAVSSPASGGTSVVAEIPVDGVS
jgi:signal transduction histidine kinase